jgi:SAM-dependent methyltransferase
MSQTQATRVAAVREKLGRGGYESRTRSLEDVDERLSPSGTTLAAAIEAALHRCGAERHGAPVAVLEIGFGWGPALIALAWRFRAEPVTFSGINLERKHPVECPEDLAVVAEALDLVPPERIAEFEPPDLGFYDATTLRHDDDSLDLVYSAVTLRFVADKMRLIEDVARALRPGGRAILDVAERGWRYRAGHATHPRHLTDRPSYLVLHHGGEELVPLEDYLAFAGGDRFTIRVPPSRRCVVDITKHAPGRLDTGLSLDERRTFPMREFPMPPDRRAPGSGVVRSAYAIAPDRMAAYRAAARAPRARTSG